jgi:hypothetical protein
MPFQEDPLAGYTPDWRKQLGGGAATDEQEDPLAGYDPGWRDSIQSGSIVPSAGSGLPPTNLGGRGGGGPTVLAPPIVPDVPRARLTGGSADTPPRSHLEAPVAPGPRPPAVNLNVPVDMASDVTSVDPESAMRSTGLRQEEADAAALAAQVPTADKVVNAVASFYRAGTTELPAGILEAAGLAAREIQSMLGMQAGERPVTEQAMFQAGQKIRELGERFYPGDQRLQRDFLATVLPSALGSFTAYIGLSAATGGAGAALAPPALAARGAAIGRTAGAATAAGGGGVSQMYREAEEAGASEDVARQAGRRGVVPGIIQVVPVLRALGRYNPAAAIGVGGAIRQGAAGAIEEGVTEMVGQIGFNKIAQDLYDTDRYLSEGVLAAGSAGGAAGFLASFLLSMAGVRTGNALAVPGQTPGPGQHDAYAVLGVSPTATDADIDAAFRARAKDVHPDVSTDPNATVIFQNLSEARDAIMRERGSRPAQQQESEQEVPAAQDLRTEDPLADYTPDWRAETAAPARAEVTDETFQTDEELRRSAERRVLNEIDRRVRQQPFGGEERREGADQRDLPGARVGGELEEAARMMGVLPGEILPPPVVGTRPAPRAGPALTEEQVATQRAATREPRYEEGQRVVLRPESILAQDLQESTETERATYERGEFHVEDVDEDTGLITLRTPDNVVYEVRARDIRPLGDEDAEERGQSTLFASALPRADPGITPGGRAVMLEPSDDADFDTLEVGQEVRIDRIDEDLGTADVIVDWGGDLVTTYPDIPLDMLGPVEGAQAAEPERAALQGSTAEPSAPTLTVEPGGDRPDPGTGRGLESFEPDVPDLLRDDVGLTPKQIEAVATYIHASASDRNVGKVGDDVFVKLFRYENKIARAIEESGAKPRLIRLLNQQPAVSELADVEPHDEGRVMDEGPFDTHEDALEFAESEVGVAYEIVEQDDGFVVRTGGELATTPVGTSPDSGLLTQRREEGRIAFANNETAAPPADMAFGPEREAWKQGWHEARMAAPKEKKPRTPQIVPETSLSPPVPPGPPTEESRTDVTTAPSEVSADEPAPSPGARDFPVYEGEKLSWSLNTTNEDRSKGYPRLRTVVRAMIEQRPDQLDREKRDLVKGSFDRAFGAESKRVLAIIEEEEAAAASPAGEAEAPATEEAQGLPEPPSPEWRGPRPEESGFALAINTATELQSQVDEAWQRVLDQRKQAARSRSRPGSKTRDRLQRAEEDASFAHREISKTAKAAQEEAFDLRLQAAVADPANPLEVRWAAAAKLAERRGEGIEKAYRLLRDAAQEAFKAAGMDAAQVGPEAVRLAGSLMSTPLSPTYRFETAIPDRVAAVEKEGLVAGGLTQLKETLQKYGVMHSTGLERRMGRASTPEERQAILDEAEETYSAEKERRDAAEAAQREKDSEVEAGRLARAVHFPGFKTTLPRAWSGTVTAPDSPIITDGHTLVRRSAVVDKQKKRLGTLQKRQPSAGRRGDMVLDEKHAIWVGPVAGATDPVDIVGIIPMEEGDVAVKTARAVLRRPDGEPIIVNADKLTLLHQLTEFDELRAPEKEERAIVAYRAGTPVGLVMPLRRDVEGVASVEALERALAGRVPGATPEERAQVEEAFVAWLGRLAHIDGAGKYRVGDTPSTPTRANTKGRKVAPWNRLIKKLFPDNDAFHRAAEAWEASQGETEAEASLLDVPVESSEAVADKPEGPADPRAGFAFNPFSKSEREVPGEGSRRAESESDRWHDAAQTSSLDEVAGAVARAVKRFPQAGKVAYQFYSETLIDAVRRQGGSHGEALAARAEDVVTETKRLLGEWDGPRAAAQKLVSRGKKAQRVVDWLQAQEAGEHPAAVYRRIQQAVEGEIDDADVPDQVRRVVDAIRKLNDLTGQELERIGLLQLRTETEPGDLGEALLTDDDKTVYRKFTRAKDGKIFLRSPTPDLQAIYAEPSTDLTRNPLFDQYVEMIAAENDLEVDEVGKIIDIVRRRHFKRVHAEIPRIFENHPTDMWFTRADGSKELVPLLYTHPYQYAAAIASSSAHRSAFVQEFGQGLKDRQLEITVDRALQARINPDDTERLLRSLAGMNIDLGVQPTTAGAGPTSAPDSPERDLGNWVSYLMRFPRASMLTRASVPNLFESFGNIQSFGGGLTRFVRAMYRLTPTEFSATRDVIARQGLAQTWVMHATLDRQRFTESLPRVYREWLLRAFPTVQMWKLQELQGAVMGVVMAEDLRTGRSKGLVRASDQFVLKNILDFSETRAAAIASGQGTDEDYLEVARRFATRSNTTMLTLPPEESRAAGSRWFHEIFPFQRYSQMKIRSFAKLHKGFVDALGRYKKDPSRENFDQVLGGLRTLATYHGGTAAAGTLTHLFLALLAGGVAGLQVKLEDFEDKPIRFMLEGWVYAQFGPIATSLARIWTDRRIDNFWMFSAPASVMKETIEATMGWGEYQFVGPLERAMRASGRVAPGPRAVMDILTSMGLTEKDPQRELALRTYWEWSRENAPPEARTEWLRAEADTKEFRKHMGRAYREIRKEASTRTIERTRVHLGRALGVEGKDASSVAASIRGRRLLSRLDDAQLRSLRDDVGPDLFQTLQAHDALLDRWSAAATPAGPRPPSPPRSPRP